MFRTEIHPNLSIISQNHTEFSPTIGNHVYPYREFYQLDSEGKRVRVNVNLYLRDENIVVEKVAEGHLLSRISFVHSEVINNPDFDLLNRLQYSTLYQDYKIWQLMFSPEAINREKVYQEKNAECDRFQKDLEHDFLIKASQLVFYETPKMVYEKTLAFVINVMVLTRIFFLPSIKFKKIPNGGLPQRYIKFPEKYQSTSETYQISRNRFQNFNTLRPIPHFPFQFNHEQMNLR